MGIKSVESFLGWRLPHLLTAAALAVSVSVKAQSYNILDPTSPTAIITSPVYANVPGNIFHTTLYPEKSPEQNIIALKLFKENEAVSAIEDFKSIRDKNEWFEDFCNKWQKVSIKYNLTEEQQRHLFQWMHEYAFLKTKQLGIQEYLWSIEPTLLNTLSELSSVWKRIDCVSLNQKLQKILLESKDIRNKEEQEFYDMIKLITWGTLGFIWFMILAFWINERRF